MFPFNIEDLISAPKETLITNAHQCGRQAKVKLPYITEYGHAIFKIITHSSLSTYILSLLHRARLQY